MTYRESCILLPCHSLEDFPMHYEGDEAAGLLAAWTALWHPALLATTGSAPNWYRADSPPSDLDQRLLVAPGVSEGEIPTGFPDRARQEGARVILGNHPRQWILDQALPPLAPHMEALDDQLAADFLALGYCYLQVELLTRQMRYSTNLDEIHFYNQAVAGAKAAMAGHNDEARDTLAACFDLLAQERDHYYAVDAYILDFTLLAPTTLGASLESQLAVGVPSNLYLTGELLEQLERESPHAMATLRRALADGTVGLIGGEQSERRLPLYGCETVLSQFREGLRRFDRLLDTRPQVYGRRRFGICVLHPQLLRRLGYIGMLHATLDEGKFPEGRQIKVRWEGLDLSTIDMLGRVPLDASRPDTFLSYASKLGETMDMDHVATICLAHWPGHVCESYEDLRRTANYGNMLGKFVTVEQYFRDTDYAGQVEHFQTDQYRSRYLQRAVEDHQADPISSVTRYWRRRAAAEAAQALESVVSLVGSSQEPAAPALLAEIDASVDHETDPRIDERLAAALDQAVARLADCIPRADAPAETGYLVLNPSSCVRRAGLDLPALAELPDVEKPVYAAAAEGDHKFAVVDVPPMGFAWITAGRGAELSKRPPQLLAEANRVRNEFFEAHVNPVTGALQALYEYNTRGNRLSQQLALRMPPDPGADPGRGTPQYSVMAADRVEVTAATPTLGEITVAGRLVDRQGRTLADYQQRFRAWRGSRVLHLHIELEPHVAPGSDPWNSYYACRFAWADESALLWRGVNQLRERGEAKRLEAPNYIDIDQTSRHTTILTGGIPFHRRTDLRMLDTLLIVRGERARSFHVGIGVDVKYPLHEAMALLAPPTIVQQVAGPPQPSPSSWLFHLDCRNLLATHWEPIVDEGQVRGFRVRLLETAGRPARAKLRCFRPVASARQVDFRGESLGSCAIQDGAIGVDMNAHEWTEIEANW